MIIIMLTLKSWLFIECIVLCPQNECYSLEGIDEVYEFLRLQKSMEMVGFTTDVQKRYEHM